MVFRQGEHFVVRRMLARGEGECEEMLAAVDQQRFGRR